MIFETFLTFLSKIFCFTSYVTSGTSFPAPLSDSEERECLLLCKNGDKTAREKLIRHNLRLVAHVVKKYAGAGEADDLISVGTIGLIKGIESYQFDKGSILATYCAKCVDNEILMYIRSNKKHKKTISLSDTVGIDKDGNEVSLMDVTPADDENGYVKIENSVVIEKIKKIMLEVLPKREIEIISMRYGLFGYESKTQNEVAKTLGISRSYVSRLEKKIINKISLHLL